MSSPIGSWSLHVSSLLGCCFCWLIRLRPLGDQCNHFKSIAGDGSWAISGIILYQTSVSSHEPHMSEHWELTESCEALGRAEPSDSPVHVCEAPSSVS